MDGLLQHAFLTNTKFFNNVLYRTETGVIWHEAVEQGKMTRELTPRRANARACCRNSVKHFLPALSRHLKNLSTAHCPLPDVLTRVEVPRNFGTSFLLTVGRDLGEEGYR